MTRRGLEDEEEYLLWMYDTQVLLYCTVLYSVLYHCTVLNEPDITQPLNFYFCTTNSVFSANNSVFIFLSVIFMSKSCLHEKSPVVF